MAGRVAWYLNAADDGLDANEARPVSNVAQARPTVQRLDEQLAEGNEEGARGRMGECARAKANKERACVDGRSRGCERG